MGALRTATRRMGCLLTHRCLFAHQFIQMNEVTGPDTPSPLRARAPVVSARSAEQYACLFLRIKRHKQRIESFRQGGVGEDAFL
jgi:hypothetical protein